MPDPPPLPPLASRGEVAPFYVMEVMKAAGAREAAGNDVLHLEVGQPSTGAPADATANLGVLLDSGALGYTDALGITPLRDRIAASYQGLYGVTVNTERVALTTGASGAFTLTFLACFDPGARVGLLEPGYPCYRNTLEALNVEVVGIRVGPETRFQPTAAMLDAAGPLDGLIVASPSNPTGSALTDSELDGIAGWAKANGVRLIVDEIYHRISYGSPTPTALSSWDQAIVINSFSKYYSMTGWRLGWIVAPNEVVERVERLAQNLTIAPPTLSQHVALAAFDCTEELDHHVERYARNREILLEALPKAQMTTLAPADGAFYVYADVSGLTSDSQDLSRLWLEQIGIAATPGVDFDPGQGQSWMRFSFAGSTADISDAAARLVSWSRSNR